MIERQPPDDQPEPGSPVRDPMPSTIRGLFRRVAGVRVAVAQSLRLGMTITLIQGLRAASRLGQVSRSIKGCMSGRKLT